MQIQLMLKLTLSDRWSVCADKVRTGSNFLQNADLLPVSMKTLMSSWALKALMIVGL